MIYKGVSSKLKVDKNDFYEEIKKSKEQDKLTPKATQYFIQLATHGVKHGKLHYPDYRDEEDCIQAALLDLLKHWRNFNEELFKDPFSYFSSCVFNGYANQFKTIHKHRFFKESKLYKVTIESDFCIEKIYEEIKNVVLCLLENVKERDIKKIQIRFKGDRFCKWEQIRLDSLESMDFLEPFQKEFDYVKFFEIKFEYINGIEFVKLDQSDDESEIFNI